MRGIALSIVLLASPSFAADQSMAEAAKKTRERREKNAKEGVKPKIYTQDDVEKAPPLANDPNTPPPPAGAHPTPSPAPARASAGDSASPGATVGGQSENAWRGRVADARHRIESARKEYEFWSGYTMAPGEILVDDKDRPVITTIEQLQGKVAAAQKAWEAAEKALVNLEEEARRASVPPGWLR
jgi:hypothetical protein